MPHCTPLHLRPPPWPPTPLKYTLASAYVIFTLYFSPLKVAIVHIDNPLHRHLTSESIRYYHKGQSGENFTTKMVLNMRVPSRRGILKVLAVNTEEGLSNRQLMLSNEDLKPGNSLHFST
jgi:hypothetical protein